MDRLKWIGMVFVICAAAYGGISLAADLRKRSGLLRNLEQSLQILKGELRFCGTALPQAFAVTGAGSDADVRKLWLLMAEEMKNHRWLPAADCMRRSLKQLPSVSANKQASEVLVKMCAGLGSYDLDYQILCIEQAADRLCSFVQEAEREQKGKCKMYRALGFSMGLAIVILLI